MAKKNKENPLEELEKAYVRWQDIYENGGSDPFYADGSSLNLVRNHIFYYKRQIEETCPLYMADDLYQREPPPKVSHDYMARPDEIRAAAKKSLETYLADSNYQYLLRQQGRLTQQQAKATSIAAVLGYAKGLQMAIDKDDLVSMRCHRDPERYLESFRDCVERVRAVLESGVPNLFAMAEENEDMDMTM